MDVPSLVSLWSDRSFDLFRDFHFPMGAAHVSLPTYRRNYAGFFIHNPDFTLKKVRYTWGMKVAHFLLLDSHTIGATVVCEF